MAPEVISGKKYSKKVDIYSWSVILWEMITRQQPFKGIYSLSLSLSPSSYFFYFHYYTEAQTHFAVERAVLNGERPPIPPGLPRTIEEIITTCWTTKPEKRPEFNELFDIL